MTAYARRDASRCEAIATAKARGRVAAECSSALLHSESAPVMIDVALGRYGGI